MVNNDYEHPDITRMQEFGTLRRPDEVRTHCDICEEPIYEGQDYTRLGCLDICMKCWALAEAADNKQDDDDVWDPADADDEADDIIDFWIPTEVDDELGDE